MHFYCKIIPTILHFSINSPLSFLLKAAHLLYVFLNVICYDLFRHFGMDGTNHGKRNAEQYKANAAAWWML